MMMERMIKILMSAGLAVLAALIAFGNIHDPGSNLSFVQHILSMDTIAPNNPMASHAMPVPPLWVIAFWLIVAAEGLTSVLYALGTVELWRARSSKARAFQRAKRFVYAGAACDSSSGSSVSLRSAENGSRCGSPRCGTASRRRSASPRSFSSS